MAMDDDEISSSDDSSDAPAAADTPAESAPSPINPQIAQYLQAKQDQMAQAQDQARQNQMGVGLARAGATLANALSGNSQQVDQRPFDQLESEAQAPVQDEMNKQKSALNDLSVQKQLTDASDAAAASDPNSSKSITARALFKKNYPEAVSALSPEQFNKMTADDVVSQMKDQEVKAKIDNTREIAGQRSDDARAKRLEQRDKAQDAMDDKDGKALDGYLQRTWAARSGAAGATQNKINAAEAAEKLIEQGRTQEGGLDSRQIEELAESTSRLLGGGASASARVEALVPHTFWGKVQSLKEWASNSPTGQDLQQFTDRMAETIAREKALAQEQKMRYQIEGLQSHARLQRNNPDLYNRILSSKGIYPDMIDEKGQFKSAGSAPAAQSADLHASVAAEVQRRKAAKAQAAVNSAIPNIAAQTNAQGVPSSLQPNQPEGYAYGGMVGGLPSSNYTASQSMRPMHQPHLNLHALRGYSMGGEVCNYADGGMVPGQPQMPFETPMNDTVQARLTPKEVVLPLHVTQAKDPALASYLYMKRLHGKGV